LIFLQSPSHTATSTQALGDIIANENRKAAIDTKVEHLAEDVDSPPPAAPAPEVRETSAIADIPEGNAICNGSDEAEAPNGGVRSPADESIELRLETAPPASMEQQQCAPPLDLKQNKYAQDFFKHVNDVKRSIYQSEMQRNNSLESARRGPRAGSNINSNPKASPKRAVSQEPRPEPVVTTLPLSRGRSATGPKPTPAPRTSLQAQNPLPDSSVSSK